MSSLNDQNLQLREEVEEETAAAAAGTTAAGLDVADTDDYLQSLLVPRALVMLKHFDFSQQHHDVLLPWIQALLQSATLLVTLGQTPAMRALGLTASTTATTTSSPSASPPKAPGIMREQDRVALGKWIVLSVLLPTMYQQLRTWYIHSSSDSTSSTTVEVGMEDAVVENDSNEHDGADMNVVVIVQRARQRRRLLVKNFINLVDRARPIMRLYVLLSWWWRRRPSRRTSSPGLAMALAGMSLVPATSTMLASNHQHDTAAVARHDDGQGRRQRQRRPHHLLFAHRRWLYQELVRTLNVVTPFSSWNDVLQCWISLVRPIKEAISLKAIQWQQRNKQRDQPDHDACRQCPLCGSTPITIPYVTNCGHVYCYSCLWSATAKNGNHHHFRCLICRHVVSSIQPHLVVRAAGTTVAAALD